MKKLKIAMGDLRHNTVGRHSVHMPIGIGYLTTYTISQVGKENLDIRLFADPDNLLKAIDIWKPDILALSNYCWNNEASRVAFEFAKKLNPKTICIGGGPDIPEDQSECQTYLTKRSDMDFYVYLDGEVAFAQIIQKIRNGEEIEKLKTIPQDSIMSIHPETGDLVKGPMAPRLMDMDVIPSPYLSGLMDQFFESPLGYAPMIETARGCPFSCTFCVQGDSYYSKIAKFSTDRIKKELHYMAERVRPHIPLSFCDSNFAMYKRDEEIAEYLRYLQDNYSWPNSFNVTTGKSNFKRIMRVVEKLQNKMIVSTSVQSLNDETLDLIKRKNLPMEAFHDVQKELKKRGQFTSSEIILPMPGETKASFLKGSELLLNEGVDRILPYTTMMLKGTEMASPETRDTYKMQTRWRVLPRQFGEYYGQKVFEVEEVCVATNTMSFEDYLDCRGFALIVNTFASKYFDIFIKHNQELEVTPYDFYYDLWSRIKSGKTVLSDIFNRFIQETKDELWDSREALIEHFSEPENYKKLMKGDLGDNLLRKYSTIIFIEQSEGTFALGYSILKKHCPDLTIEIERSLASAQEWFSTTRDISPFLSNDNLFNNTQILELDYDIQSWYQGKESDPLVGYKKNTDYLLYHGQRQKGILDESIRIYGKEPYYRMSKTMLHWGAQELWWKTDLILD